ncbi:late secretory pathway protein AVL9-like [Papaver somniferum]|uniref:late secretory pathway protein AVL9-like n=1 Tax=Papaver somniferum TaxID=3469 RepID=UPI000E703ED5|nr:late secretory pathway protein AVL9-like [Papaver somniferum]
MSPKQARVKHPTSRKFPSVDNPGIVEAIRNKTKKTSLRPRREGGQNLNASHRRGSGSKSKAIHNNEPPPQAEQPTQEESDSDTPTEEGGGDREVAEEESGDEEVNEEETGGKDGDGQETEDEDDGEESGDEDDGEERPQGCHSSYEARNVMGYDEELSTTSNRINHQRS